MAVLTSVNTQLSLIMGGGGYTLRCQHHFHCFVRRGGEKKKKTTGDWFVFCLPALKWMKWDLIKVDTDFTCLLGAAGRDTSYFLHFNSPVVYWNFNWVWVFLLFNGWQGKSADSLLKQTRAQRDEETPPPHSLWSAPTCPSSDSSPVNTPPPFMATGALWARVQGLSVFWEERKTSRRHTG